MKRLRFVLGLLLLAVVLGLAGCEEVRTTIGKAIGPAYVKQEAASYLLEGKVPCELIQKIIHMEPLSAEEVGVYSRHRAWQVRDLIAGNPSTHGAVLERLAKDENQNVRGQVAQNPNLTVALMLALQADSSIYTRRGLARNPMVPEDVILAVFNREKRGEDIFDRIFGSVSYDSYAWNPYCPEPIREEVRAKEPERLRAFMERWVDERAPEHMRLVNEWNEYQAAGAK